MNKGSLIIDEFNSQFRNEQACAAAIIQARWPQGFRCPACGYARSYLLMTRRLPLFECASPSCRRQTSIIAGTIMEGSRTPLTKWLLAYRLLSYPEGISSMRLSKILEVTYKTAWLISHKIRTAMHEEENSEKLRGYVRIEPFHYGLFLYPVARHPLLLAAAMDEQGNPARIVMHQPHPSDVIDPLRKINPDGIHSFVRRRVSEYAIVGHRRDLEPHRLINFLKQSLTIWLNFTFHGIGAKHLQAYLDEFCFRHNAKSHGPDYTFRLLLHWSVNTRRKTYRALTRSRPVLAHPWVRLGITRNKWRGKHLSSWCS